MRRGELYRVPQAHIRDPKRARVVVVVSRQAFIETTFSTVICAPVYSQHDRLATQVAIGVDEGLKHESSILCDALVSVPKAALTNYVGRLSAEKLHQLDAALKIALALDS